MSVESDLERVRSMYKERTRGVRGGKEAQAYHSCGWNNGIVTYPKKKEKKETRREVGQGHVILT